MALRRNPFALVSVTVKAGIVEWCREIIALGFQIIASGGTAKVIREGGLEVIDTATIVGPAILDHRVSTLSRELHAGLLARIPEDEQKMAKLGMQFVDLVCVDFYKLEEEIAQPGATLKSVIEKTDIGGPAMARSGAKGNRIVICVPEDREPVLQWLQAGMPDEDAYINELAAKAEFVVAKYGLVSAKFRSNDKYDGMLGTRVLNLRYGENAWQSPATYFMVDDKDPLAFHKFERIEETPPSMVNVLDVDRLLQTITHVAAAFDLNMDEVPLIAIGCKHGNPCGAACGHNPEEVIRKMVLGDPLALFGGMVITNFPITVHLAEFLLTVGGKRVLDGVIAPMFSPNVFDTLKRRDQKCRLYSNPALGNLSKTSINTEMMRVPVRGGYILQPNYTYILDFGDKDFACRATPRIQRTAELLLAWAIGSTSNSNTITLVKDGMLIGNGVGQQDRVTACKVALMRSQQAKHDTNDAVAYSDSFFPFKDGPELLSAAGIRTILATNGSKNDPSVIDFCTQAGIALWSLPDAKGRGFFGH